AWLSLGLWLALALSSPVGIGIVVTVVGVDCRPRRLCKMILELREFVGGPVADVGHGNPGIAQVLRRVNMAVAPRSAGRDGHVEGELEHRDDRVPTQVR